MSRKGNPWDNAVPREADDQWTATEFDPPKTKKIAVKVINHYGDEVLKVFAI